MAKKKNTQPNDYNKLQTASSNYCDKPTETNKKRLEKAEEKYRKSAADKGKPKKEINQIVSRVKKCNR